MTTTALIAVVVVTLVARLVWDSCLAVWWDELRERWEDA